VTSQNPIHAKRTILSRGATFERSRVPVTLAAGLSADNFAQAIAAMKPRRPDRSSNGRRYEGTLSSGIGKRQ